MASINLKNCSLDIPIYNYKKIFNLKQKKISPGGEIAVNDNINVIKVLKNINLEIKNKSIVGIIGHNGSGKSSLLRVLSGIYPPSNGVVKINGDVTAIHNMGQGINPSLSGFENIYLRGYLLGLEKNYIDSKLNFIAEFSELGDFLNLPLKTYSAGMISRLLFSINIIKKFDILLVDEGLGAGDVNFITKVRKKTKELLEDAKICVYVSHNINFFKSIGARIITLEKGKIINDTHA